MTIKTPTQDQITAALGDAGKAAMLGLAGGPIGAAAGGLLALASDLVPAIFGADAKPALADAAAFITKAPTEAAQVAALTKDPAATEAFRIQCLQIAADQQKQRDADIQQVRQMLLEQGKTDAADTANARQQTVQLAQAGSSIAYGAPIVSVIVLVAFASLAITVLLRAVPDGNQQLADIMLGTLGTMAANVASYWVGSSSGSQMKTALLAQSVPSHLLPNPAAVVPAADAQPN